MVNKYLIIWLLCFVFSVGFGCYCSGLFGGLINSKFLTDDDFKDEKKVEYGTLFGVGFFVTNLMLFLLWWFYIKNKFDILYYRLFHLGILIYLITFLSALIVSSLNFNENENKIYITPISVFSVCFCVYTAILVLNFSKYRKENEIFNCFLNHEELRTEFKDLFDKFL